MSEIDRNRKDDHLNMALKFHNQNQKSDFDDLEFIHQVFPNINFNDVDISTKIAGFDLTHPFYINAMTGGSNFTKKYNEKLAILARETGTMMAVGSLSIALKDKETEESFRIVRKLNPNGIIFANLGADKTLDEVKRACEIIKADGIQIHVNAAQEIVMPEGDRDFSNWLENISEIVNNVDIPVIIKEVGNGMSREAISKLLEIGVKTVDISGKGGTNFNKIENERRTHDKYDFLLDFGNSTVISLLEAQEYLDRLEIISSGGIRNSMDIIKSLSLGASSVAMAGRMLKLLDEYPLKKAIEIVNNWKYQIKAIMTLLGAKNIAELRKKDLIIKNEVKNWCEIRGIDYKRFGNRAN